MFIRYDESKNPMQATLPGVPLADMTQQEFDALPAWLRRSVCACPFYTVPPEVCEAAQEPAPAADEAPVVDIQANDEVISDE